MAKKTNKPVISTKTGTEILPTQFKPAYDPNSEDEDDPYRLSEETLLPLLQKLDPNYPVIPPSRMDYTAKVRAVTAMAHTGRNGYTAMAAGVCPQTIANHMKDDENFAEAMQQALALWRDRLEMEVYNRAVVGWIEPVFGKAGQIGTIRRKSERLLELLIKRHMTEYRDKQSIDMSITGGVLAVAGQAESTETFQAAADRYNKEQAEAIEGKFTRID